MSVPVAAEILRGAAREVEKGWCRGIVQNQADEVCAIGALRRAAHVRWDLLHKPPEYGKAAKALADVFEEQYPDQSDARCEYLRAPSPESIIWRFNDLVVPDKFAVVAAMEKAANNLEA